MYKKILSLILISLLIYSCNNNKKKGNLLVKGIVKGLRLGTLKIKQQQKDSLIILDSIKVDGQEKFAFYTNIEEPQTMVLELPEVKDGHILFFAAPNDTIKIFAYVESFGINPIIKGGINQNRKNEFDKMIRQFNNKEMDLFKAKFEASKQHLLQEADSLGKKMDNLQRKRKLYALNFIFRNKEHAIAPYIALTEFTNNPKALDTIYKSLTPEIQQTKYAKEIKKILQKTLDTIQ